MPFESVDFVGPDIDRVVAGGGSHSARSMRIASLAIGTASDARGVFAVKGTDRRIGIFEVAKAAATRNDLLERLRGKLDGIGDETVSVGAFPSSTHVCEVEIDPETARCGWCGGRASMMSASRSIR